MQARRYRQAGNAADASEVRRTVDAARSRPIGLRVTVVLAQPPAGAVALVLRRRLVDPFDVIGLGPDATADMLIGNLPASGSRAPRSARRQPSARAERLAARVPLIGTNGGGTVFLQLHSPITGAGRFIPVIGRPIL